MTPEDKMNQRRNVDALLAKVFGGSPPSTESPQKTSPAISEELDELMWLFLEDALPESDEERLWQLAAQEPGALEHFQAMLADFEAMEASELTPALTGRPAFAADVHDLAAKTWKQMNQAFDLLIEVATDYFLGSSSQALGLGAVRGSSERLTSVTRTLLRSVGIFNLTIDHAGSGLCHVSLEVVESSSSHPPEGLTVVAKKTSGAILDSQKLVAGLLQFRNLPPGDYILEFQSEARKVDQCSISLVASDIT